MRIAMLSGGVGGGRFLSGLVRVVDPAELTVVVNTGDDDRMRGLVVCPDVDSVLYHLCGVSDWERGWGIAGDTFSSNQRYAALAAAAGDVGIDPQEWFGLGDLDLATHQFRTRLLDAGLKLSEVTDALRRALVIPCRVLPMAESPVRTTVRTTDGRTLGFEDYFVRLHQDVDVAAIGIDGALPAVLPEGAVEAIEAAEVIGITPSNPLVSIGPILAIPSYTDAVRFANVPRFGVSPIVGGRALKGPAARLLSSLGHEPSAFGAATFYRGLVDVWVVDESDAQLADRIEDELGLRVVALDTIMRSPQDSARLAKEVLEAL